MASALLLLLLALFASSWTPQPPPVEATDQITTGFSTSPTKTPPPPASSFGFHPLIEDPTGNFSFGFLRVGIDRLDLAVVHVPSSLPLWRALGGNDVHVTWKPSTTLTFDGSLVLADETSGSLYWSSSLPGNGGKGGGDGSRLVLLNTSNLQITGGEAEEGGVVWQSFDYPSETIVQDQNFTSKAELHSGNNRFSMRLGRNFLGLYYDNSTVMYWKQTALEARADIVDGEGPIYARINSSGGYLGIYQKEGPPAHVMSFDSFKRKVSALFRRLTVGDDGDLKGYYWNGSLWVLDFNAISDMCDLPASCGAYGLCHRQGSGGSCSCLDKNTTAASAAASCLSEDTGDLCAAGINNSNNNYWVVRRRGVNLAYKEFIGFTTSASLEECEATCERNCRCWGALYSDSSGYCYQMDFPIETLVEEKGQGKVGYFKVRNTNHVAATAKKKLGSKRFLAEVALFGIGIVLVGAGIGFGILKTFTFCKERRGSNRVTGGQGGSTSMLEEGLSPVPYRDLKGSSSTTSFGSVELSTSSTTSSSFK